MIKSLSIKNFKTHKNTYVELSPTLNVFSGLSTEGKTALLSAIRLLCTNKPSGSEYISYFAKQPPETSIIIEFDDCKIEFLKTKKTAKYIIHGDEKIEFTDLNKKIPEEVQNLVKMDDDNFSWQFDLPYLLFGPKSEISKKINDVIGIQRFDEKIKEINKESLSLNREIKSKKDEVHEYKSLLKKIQNHTNIKDYLDVLEKMEKQIRENNKFLEDLENLDQRLKIKRDLNKSEKKMLEINKYIQDLRDLKDLDENKPQKIIDLKNNIKNYKESKDKEYKVTNKFKKLIKLDEEKAQILALIKNNKEQTLSIIKEKINDFNFIKNKSNKAEKVFQKIINLDKDKEKVRIEIEDLIKKLSLMEELKDIKMVKSRLKKEEELIQEELSGFDTCPECGQELKWA